MTIDTKRLDIRLDNGTIVEHWDVIQQVPETTASGNSMFSDLYKGTSAINETL